MKNKFLKLMIILAMSFMFTGCSNAGGEGESVQGETETGISAYGNNAITEYEKKYAAGEFSAEDYKALAELYAQEGMIKKQRDMLEQCYRLYADTESLTVLKSLTVNVAEESDSMQEEAKRLQMNLDTAGYLDEAVAMLISDDWMELVMPKLKEGGRSYYMTDTSGEINLIFEAGYDEAGAAYTTVWNMLSDGKVQCIMKSKGAVQMVTAGIEDGVYQGNFESWLCMAGGGDIYHEKGTFEKGILIGDYTAKVHYGQESADLFALWSSREKVEMADYTGSFENTGVTSVTQPEAVKIQVVNGGNGGDHLIAYAYTGDKSKYLFLNTSEEESAAEFVFDYTVLGMADYPVLTVYEPKTNSANAGQEQMISSEDVKVRIYDSNIEWFDGTSWHVVGNAADYIQADPFQAYEEGQQVTEDGESKLAVYKKRGAGTVKAETPANASDSSDNKSAASASSDNSNNGSNSSSNSNNSSNSNKSSSNSKSNSSSNSNKSSSSSNKSNSSSSSGSSDNGDVDIEWTNDIL